MMVHISDRIMAGLIADGVEIAEIPSTMHWSIRNSKTRVQHPLSSFLHPIQNACIVSTATELDTCTHYIPNATRPSLSFLPVISSNIPFKVIGRMNVPSCGTQVLFDHRNHSVFCRIAVFPDH